MKKECIDSRIDHALARAKKKIQNPEFQHKVWQRMKKICTLRPQDLRKRLR